MKNGQSGDIGNIVDTAHRTKTTKSNQGAGYDFIVNNKIHVCYCEILRNCQDMWFLSGWRVAGYKEATEPRVPIG